MAEWHTSPRRGHCSTCLGKHYMGGHNKHRRKEDGGDILVHLVVSLRWNGPVCTRRGERRSYRGRSQCRSSVQAPVLLGQCPPATFCRRSFHSAPPVPASSSLARHPQFHLAWEEGSVPSSSCDFLHGLCLFYFFSCWPGLCSSPCSCFGSCWSSCCDSCSWSGFGCACVISLGFACACCSGVHGRRWSCVSF